LPLSGPVGQDGCGPVTALSSSEIEIKRISAAAGAPAPLLTRISWYKRMDALILFKLVLRLR
jgi:hypothetical protein